MTEKEMERLRRESDKFREELLGTSPCSAEVPYSDVPHERPGKVKLVDGDVVRFEDGRRLEAYRSPDGPGIWFRIASPLDDGKESMLKFRISDEAACVMSELIARKFSPNKNIYLPRF